MATIRVTQHPVGQGGLLVGEITNQDDVFVWAYDCGSKHTKALACVIAELKRLKRIDVLFISHLDDDHINGIDTLLSSIGVTEIVLPYIDNPMTALLLAPQFVDGTIKQTTLDFLQDSSAWLTRRGVQKITYVDAGEVVQLPPTPMPGKIADAKTLGLTWTEPVGQEEAAPETPRRVGSDGVAAVWAEFLVAPWLFVPQVHMPGTTRMSSFRNRLEQEFGDQCTAQELADAFRSSAKRPILRECYDELWVSHNLVSMSLYAGPDYRNASNHEELEAVASQGGYPQCTPYLLGGWLSTGDANLSVHSRRSEFVKRYKDLFPGVGFFVLPHHGSQRSFHIEPIRSCINLRCAVAAAGSEYKDFPAPDVVDEMRRQLNKPVTIVTEEKSSEFCPPYILR